MVNGHRCLKVFANVLLCFIFILISLRLLLFSPAFNWGYLCKKDQNEIENLKARDFKKSGQF